MTDFAAARLNMVESQVRPNGITDRRIIAAIESVPREDFVPAEPPGRGLHGRGRDGSIPPTSAAGPRALIEVMAFARMLQHAAIKPTDKVLIVGAETGYGAAVVSQIAATVVALECDTGLAAEGQGQSRGPRQREGGRGAAGGRRCRPSSPST